MRIAIIGIGRVGSAIAYSLLLKARNLDILLCEPHEPNRMKALAEYSDLLPVAKATRNKLAFSPGIPNSCQFYVITSGHPRQTPDTTKDSLFTENWRIVFSALQRIPRNKLIGLVTNPPNRLATHARGRGWPRTAPLRFCTDELRAKVRWEGLNDFVLQHKGHTAWTPGFACAQEILAVVRAQTPRTSGNRRRKKVKV